jgi:hypothetical protein
MMVWIKAPPQRYSFIACVDGLTHFPVAIETVFPQTSGQWCIVHHPITRAYAAAQNTPLPGGMALSWELALG